VFSTALYACEARALKKTDRDKILAFEVYCYRRLLQINTADSDGQKWRDQEKAKHQKN